jgi:ornithine--oxo-acid transaminase
MPIDLAGLIEERRGDKFELFDRHLNAQLLRILRTLGFAVDYVQAEGPHLFDADGNRYLDLLSGFGVFALGRNHPTVTGALEQVLRGQLAGLVQFDVSLLAGLLAERLTGYMPWLPKLFFCNSGAEATEAAIKFSRAATGRSTILYCDHAFHGLSYGAVSLCGDEHFRARFGPFVGDCARIPFDDLEALERALARRDVAAFVVEPIQGKGVNLPHDGYLPAAARLCRAHGTLLVADEIQTGMGRTGRFLAAEHWGVEPDLVLLAKALSGGFVPVGAVACRREVFDRVFDRMDRALVHGSTFAKNDLAMAAGLATLTTLEDEGLIERAAELGTRLVDGLRQSLAPFDMVKEVRGKGMMIALQLGPPRDLRLKAAYALMDRATKGLFCQLVLIQLLRDHRILAQVAGHDLPVIKLLPPLVLDEQDLEWTLRAFAAVIGDSQSLASLVRLGRELAGHALRTRADAGAR